MTLILTALAIWFTTGVLCLAFARRPRLVQTIGPVGTVAGSLPALFDASRAILTGFVTGLHLPWSIPGANFAVGMDALSAFFTLPIVLVCALAAIYGREYLRPYEGHKALGVSWCMFNLLAASMLLVVLARNAVLFLLAWEVMSLSSFFLVMFEGEKGAGWTYLVATHIGTAFLLIMFVLLGQPSGSLDFDGFAMIGGTPVVASLVFVLAVVGFGTKAGFMPFHVWLPEAHPAAPSHVSAVMSGVMIKMGIYGLSAHAALARSAAALVGLSAGRHWGCFRRVGRTVCARPARPETSAGLPQRGKHRHHRARTGCWPDRTRQ